GGRGTRRCGCSPRNSSPRWSSSWTRLPHVLPGTRRAYYDPWREPGAARTDEDAEAQRGGKGRIRQGRAGWSGDHPEADVRPALRVRERQHVLRHLRRGADGAPARGRDRKGQKAGRPGLRADGRAPDGRLRRGRRRVARQTTDRPDQARPGRNTTDASQNREKEVTTGHD